MGWENRREIFSCGSFVDSICISSSSSRGSNLFFTYLSSHSTRACQTFNNSIKRRKGGEIKTNERERERESERIVGKYSISSQSDDHCFSCTFPSFFFFFPYILSFWVILRDREQLVLLLSRFIQIRKIVIIVFFCNKNLLKCQFLNFFFLFLSLKIPFCFVDFNLYSFFCSRVSLLELAFILFLFSFVCAMMTVFASGSLLKSRLPMRRQLRDYYIGSHPYYA